MATREDAALIMQIVQWGAQVGLDDAVHSVFADDFDPEKATHDDPAVRKLLSFGELVGTFVKQGVLDRDLVEDLWAPEIGWKRVSRAALRVREKSGEPRMYENFEALARNAPVPAGV